MATKVTISGVEYAPLMTVREVADAFRVHPGTVTKWAAAGRWPEGSVIRTLGGHRRYSAAVVAQMLADESTS